MCCILGRHSHHSDRRPHEQREHSCRGGGEVVGRRAEEGAAEALEEAAHTVSLADREPHVARSIDH